MANLDAEIGERVFMLMFRRRVTQVALARTLGLNQAGVARRLRGETGWKATDLTATAQLLNTTVAYLVGEVDDPVCTPRDLNPEPTDSGPTDDELDAWLADVISIEAAPRFREAVPA